MSYFKMQYKLAQDVYRLSFFLDYSSFKEMIDVAESFNFLITKLSS